MYSCASRWDRIELKGLTEPAALFFWSAISKSSPRLARIRYFALLHTTAVEAGLVYFSSSAVSEVMTRF
jgi:hypothetical protein